MASPTGEALLPEVNMGRKLDILKRNLADPSRKPRPAIKKPAIRMDGPDQNVVAVRNPKVMPVLCGVTDFADDTNFDRGCELTRMMEDSDMRTSVRLHVDMHLCRCPIMNLIHKIPENSGATHVVAIDLSPSAREAIYATEETFFVDSIRLKDSDVIQRLSIPMESITRVTWTDNKGNVHDRQFTPSLFDHFNLGNKIKEEFRWAKVIDTAMFKSSVFGGECFLTNFPEITKGGVRLRSSRHYGADVWHIVDDYGNRYHDTSFFSEKEMQFLVDVPNKG